MSDGLPVLVPKLDLSKLALTVDEAFVATRIDGHTSVDAIAAMVGRDTASVDQIIRKLASLGAVTFQAPRAPRASFAPPARDAGGSARSTQPPIKTSVASGADRGSISPTPPTRSPPARPSMAASGRGSVAPPASGGAHAPFVPGGDGPHDYGKYVFAPALMGEDSDVDTETKKRIVYWHDQMDGWSHYQILGIDRKGDARAVKAGYFERSKDWHPDRFRRFKQMGTYGKFAQGIYKRVSMAYKILGDDAARADYDKSLPRDLSGEDIESLLMEQIQSERDERREVERRERRLKHNPVLARFARAKDFYDKALELEQQGKLAEAMRSAQMATTYDDRKPEFKAVFERLRDQAGDERIVPYLRRGRHFEMMADWEEALSFYEEAVRIAPNNGEARVRLAYTLLHGSKNMDEVMPHAQRALSMAPEDAESHYVVARCYEERGNDKGAKRHYERAIELRPGFVEAQKRLKRLKWGF